jgi:hypothetical protein
LISDDCALLITDGSDSICELLSSAISKVNTNSLFINMQKNRIDDCFFKKNSFFPVYILLMALLPFSTSLLVLSDDIIK